VDNFLSDCFHCSFGWILNSWMQSTDHTDWESETGVSKKGTAKMPPYWRMDQENVVSIHNGILCSHEEERNVVIRW
jgi:hypothetical protein